jgi:topoisomerase-4 subunit A
MKDEEEDNINEEETNEELNNFNEESVDEGFEDIKSSSGNHFYENEENPEDTITKVFGLCFLCNSRTCCSCY